MSRTFKTQRESVIAQRRIRRDSFGAPIYPRIIVKPPTPGDVHPLPPQNLRRVLHTIPLEYLYGLRHIELRSRLNNEIGEPFGLYSLSAKKIILFSLPHEWHLSHLSRWLSHSLLKFYAEISYEEEGVWVKWPKKSVMSLWFYCEVFTHELGHHFRAQYWQKNGGYGSRQHEEFVAELHARRFTNALFKAAKSR